MHSIEDNFRKIWEQQKSSRLENDYLNKTILEEALSSYFNGNYKSAFIFGYLHLITPLCINGKRLHKKRNRRAHSLEKTTFSFNFSEELNNCIFLSHSLKTELSKVYEITIKLAQNHERIYHVNLSQLRNIISHPEDGRHRNFNYKVNFKPIVQDVLSFALQVHQEYKNYLNDNPYNKTRIMKEEKIYEEYATAL